VSNEQLILLLLVAVIANVVLSAAYLLAPRGRNGSDAGDLYGGETGPRPPAQLNRGRFGRDAAIGGGEDTAAVLDPGGADAALPETRTGLTAASYDRVVRIVSYAFLATAAAVVAVSGLYPRAGPAIYAVLGISGLLVLLIHDVLPSSALGPGKLVLEGSGAIALVTILIALTGGADSPFFLGYYLIVAGAALVVRGPATFVVAAAISLVYLITILTLPGFGTLAFEQLMRVVFNVVSLWLLSYLASVVAREQQRSRDAAVRMSLVDPLTRLGNRIFFRAAMEREIQRYDRTQRRFCLLMIDLDDLKPINDTFGHHYGDRILRTVGDVIRSGIRTIDAAARYGGDEFVVLLPETEPKGGFVVAEKLREGVSKAHVDANGRPVQTTVSIGVVAYPDDGETAEELLMAADATMYESKRKGKNRVVGRAPGRARRTAEAEVTRARARRAGGADARGADARGEGRTAGRATREARTAGRGEGRTAGRGPAEGRERGGRTGGRESGEARGPRAEGPRPAPGGSPGGERGGPPHATPGQGTRSPRSRRRRLPGMEGGGPGPPRATRRFQVLGDAEEEQIGRIMRQLLGPPAGPRPISTIEPGPQGEADNRPA
jgi:diguanylate cyclase (GGDEF)-like protein